MVRRATVTNLKTVETAPPQDSGPVNLSLLAEIVTATNSGGFVYKSIAVVAKLVELQLAEQNTEMSNGRDEFATRATPSGVKYLELNSDDEPQPVQAQPQPQPAAPVQAQASAAPLFELDFVSEVPAIKRTAGRQPVFPFDTMVAPKPGADGKPLIHRLRVAVSAKYPTPAKDLASTVQAANNRYAVETGEMETVTLSTYQTGPDGKRVKVNGHYVKTGQKTVTRSKLRQTREFIIRAEADGSASILRVL